MTSCKDCENRHFKCHATCEIYKAYTDKQKEINANRRKYNNLYAPTSKKLQKSYNSMRKFNHKYMTTGGTAE